MSQVPSAVLSCHNLGKSFGRDRRRDTVLADINLSLQQGDFVTILGQSGGGKSTLLKLMGGFLAPSSGSVSFHGQPLKGITPKIGMVFQEHSLYPWMTVEQNIGFGFKVRGELPQSYRNRVQNMIEQVELDDARKRYPHQLSGGMKQRVAIARSLVVKPDVLLLDEPFSALDVQLRRQLQAFLLAIWRETSTPMLLVTHNVEEAILLGQRLIVVGDRPGQIIAEVSTAAAEFRGRYHPKFLKLQRHLESVLEYNSATADLEYHPEETASAWQN
ncbi:ABC transporter ATP-binding protein [Romeria aff. gracilis LEGE 07310]|uniref:ABC transporter ATP-binding protein n=1 Tax=Vasconcelosia minhoensis LEGE 07310 TaxID=915328 RepID=A0A8J7AE04_9CYAN|nr:ABC transporter ATP-binding protein [Romeria gracilis]MBE9077774.1 ABC transporter ATP-binding protein [Romeria aff. gracilis LEGE 07310]